MPSLDRSKLSSLVLICLGLGIVAAVLVAFPHAGQQAYHHEVGPVDEGQVNDTYYSPVMEYEKLSPPAKDAFRAALDSGDGHHVVYGTDDAPDDWRYLTDTGPYYAFVHYQGSYYELETWGDSFEGLRGYGVGLLGFAGAAIAAVGGWRYSDRRLALDGGSAIGIAAVAVVVGLGFARDFILGSDVLPFVGGGLALVAVVVAMELAPDGFGGS